MYEFKMPSLGAEMESGKLLEWRVKPGDTVKKGDILALVETTKSNIEVETWQSGVIEKILLEPSDKEIPVGTVLALIRTEGKTEEKEVKKEVKKEDHLSDKYLPMRQAIAAAMERSNREIPHYYLETMIPMKRTINWLSQENQNLPPASRLLPVVCLIKAVSLAAKKFPEFNGFYLEDKFQPSPKVHVGIVVSLREGGLMVPCIHDTADKKIHQLANETYDLIQRTRQGTLRASEITDATISLTSLGDEGVEKVFGLIYPPQVAILGFGKIYQAMIVEKETFRPEPVITATLSADHRVSDGRRGALFLNAIRALLQEPEKL